MSRLRRAARRAITSEQHADDGDFDVDVDSHVLDEQEQQAIIDKFRAQADAQKELFKLAFTVVIVMQTPVYVTVPYFRRDNSILSLFALLSTSLSAYSLHYMKPQFSKLAGMLGLVIAGSGYWKHLPWDRLVDWVWVLPVVSSVISIVIQHWINDSYRELERLAQSRYILKGA